jgi:hypothetical protein
VPTSKSPKALPISTRLGECTVSACAASRGARTTTAPAPTPPPRRITSPALWPRGRGNCGRPSTSSTRARRRGWLKEFIAALRAATGLRKLRVYSNIALLRVQLLPKLWIDDDLDIWAARYNDTLGWDHPRLVLWQHTQSGGTPGITGAVDQSVEMHGWTPAADQQQNGDDVAWTHGEGAPAVPDLYPGRPKGSTLADPLLALAWDTAHSAVARDMATRAVQQIDALRADLAAGKLGGVGPEIDYDQLAAALLRQMSKPA